MVDWQHSSLRSTRFTLIDHSLDRIRCLARGGQRGHMGNRVGSFESHSPTHDHRSKKARRKRDIRRGLVMGNIRIAVGLICYRVARSLFTDNWLLFLLITFAGLAGSLFDSFLGATVQAMYYCPTDKKETEKHPLHTCGTETVHIRGWEWLNNDWVNFACSAFGVVDSVPIY